MGLQGFHDKHLIFLNGWDMLTELCILFAYLGKTEICVLQGD